MNELIVFFFITTQLYILKLAKSPFNIFSTFVWTWLDSSLVFISFDGSPANIQLIVVSLCWKRLCFMESTELFVGTRIGVVLETISDGFWPHYSS